MERIVKGIYVPIEIWEDHSLTWNEKVLLMEVDSFTSKGRECFISNEYIAELLGVSVNRASTTLSGLIKKGYVTQVKFDGRKRWIESNLGGRLCTNANADFAQTQRQTLQERKDTYGNNTSIDRCIESIDNNIDKCSYTHTRTREGFDFLEAVIQLGVSRQVAEDWMKVRHTKRATNTSTAFRNVAAEIAKSGRTAEDCIRFVAERSWAGFKAEWMNEESPRHTRPSAPRREESLTEHYARVNRELEQILHPNGPDYDNQ